MEMDVPSQQPEVLLRGIYVPQNNGVAKLLFLHLLIRMGKEKAMSL